MGFIDRLPNGKVIEKTCLKLDNLKEYRELIGNMNKVDVKINAYFSDCINQVGYSRDFKKKGVNGEEAWNFMFNLLRNFTTGKLKNYVTLPFGEISVIVLRKEEKGRENLNLYVGYGNGAEWFLRGGAFNAKITQTQ